MVRRDLEADGGFGQFFAETVERGTEAAETSVRRTAGASSERGLTDRMGQLNHPRGGRLGSGAEPSGAEPGGARSGELFRNTSQGGVIEKLRRETRPASGSGVVDGHGPRSAGPDKGRLESESALLEPSRAQLSTYHRPHRYYGETDPRGVGVASVAHVANFDGGSATEQERRLARRRSVGWDDEGGPGDSPASI